MGLETILTGIGAILTAAGGFYVILHEFRRRDRRAMQKEIDDLSTELSALQHDYLDLRKFMLQVSQVLMDNGIEPPIFPRHNS